MLETKRYNALDLALPTNFRAMLRSKEILWGTGCKIPHEEAARIVATLPHQFCFIDVEHTPINGTLLTTIIKAIQYTSGGSMVPYVRIPESAPEMVNYALNAGAGGIAMPHVQNARQAEAFVRLTKFPPLGVRSYPPMALFGNQTRTNEGETVYDVWNTHAAIFCQIEDVEGVKNVDEIAKVRGVDGLMVGATDLRFSLGLAAGTPDGDETVFLDALSKIQKAADHNDLAVLGFAVTPEIVRRRLRLGWRALICHADASGIFHSGTKIVETYQQIADQVLRPRLATYRLYGYEQNPRTRIVRIVAAAEGIPLDLCEVIPRQDVGKEEYMKKFPLSRGKIPGIEGPRGFRLTETIAISVYLAGIRSNTKLLGDGSEEQRAQILTWMSWANQELLPTLAIWFLPLIPFSHDPVATSPSVVAKGKEASLRLLDILEDHIRGGTKDGFLVGNQITLADIVVITIVARGMEWVLDKPWRQDHPNIMNLASQVSDWPPFNAIVPSLYLVESVDEKRRL